MARPTPRPSRFVVERSIFPYWVESRDLNQGDVGGISPGQAVDGYVHVEMVDRYHRTVHGRASYDGAGSPITVLVHDPIAHDNAARFKGRLYSGDIVLAAPDAAYVACLDVVAHEFLHGVNGATLSLVYESQSGAIDEALADVFGSFVEHYHAPNEANNVLIAEASTLPHRTHPIRNLRDPASQGDPDHMDGYENLPVAGDSDLGGVHVNSTIVSHAWYLMTLGGTHARSQVTVTAPTGWDESEQLFNAVVEGRAQAPTASFLDFARVTFATAYQLRSAAGAGQQLPPVPETDEDGKIAPPPSPVRAVGCAWYAVGVLQEDELAEHWGIRCDGDASEAPPLDCFTGGQKCGEDQVCAWNGPGNGYCCKAPWEGQQTCFTDKECAPGICSRGANNKFDCTEPNAQPCETSSAASQQPSARFTSTTSTNDTHTRRTGNPQRVHRPTRFRSLRANPTARHGSVLGGSVLAESERVRARPRRPGNAASVLAATDECMERGSAATYDGGEVDGRRGLRSSRPSQAAREPKRGAPDVASAQTGFGPRRRVVFGNVERTCDESSPRPRAARSA